MGEVFYCPAKQEDIIYEEIDSSDRATVIDLEAFYTEVYMECFPDENERESFDNLLYYLKEAKEHTSYKYHVIVAKNEADEMIGGAIFDYFKKTNAGVIEFLAVKADHQSAGIGSAIYNYVQMMLSADAFEMSNQKLSHIFCEIDSPGYSRSSVKKYLYFWDKHRFKHIDLEYIQPALSRDQVPVTGLWLTVMSMSDMGQTIERNYVLDVIADYMRYSMQINDPDQDPAFTSMMEATKKQPNLHLLEII